MGAADLEIKLATVKSSISNRTQGDVYFDTAQVGTIGKITADGSSVNTNWATLPGEANFLAGSLYFDQTGVFGYDLASGTLDEIVTVASQIPDNQIAQSFTPSLSVVGFVQFSQNVPAFVGNDQVNFVVNLRQGAYNGPATEVGHLTRLGRREAKGLTHASRGQRPGTCLAPY